ncbi:MAG: leucine-rich repeat domain-containing protein [Paludibacteraceae bacterium]|nr:leucine-rich repeat domain-containing protein [Paludibacteraceae bacterium]
MKRFRQFFVCVLLTVSFNVAAVTNFEVDGIGYSSEDGKYATIVSVKDKDYEGEVTIPVVVNYDGKTYGVKSIGDNACKGRTGITKVTISNGITSIGNSAFAGCGNLNSVNIPNSITTIGSYAFSGCYVLSNSIELPQGIEVINDHTFSGCTLLPYVKIPSSVKSIGEYSFFYCHHLTSVVIPDGTISVGAFSFCGCERLETIDFSNSITYIGSYAFSGCSRLSSVNIPKNVTEIDMGAFSGCAMLTSINVDPDNTVYDSRDNCNAIIKKSNMSLVQGCKNTIFPTGVKSIGPDAFYGCSGLTSIEIPKTVTSIGMSAFDNCANLYSVTIPEDVNEIWYSAFRNCISLTDIIIPNGVSVVESQVFYGCTSLSNIDIPSSVTTINEMAFSNCTGLKRIICRADMPPTITSNDVFANVGSDVEVYVPCASLVDYMIADGWNYFDSSNFKCIEDLVNVNESTSENIKDAISISEKLITVNGKDPSDIRVYNTAGLPVGNPVPASGVYVVKVGDEAVKVMVK